MVHTGRDCSRNLPPLSLILTHAKFIFIWMSFNKAPSQSVGFEQEEETALLMVLCWYWLCCQFHYCTSVEQRCFLFLLPNVARCLKKISLLLSLHIEACTFLFGNLLVSFVGGSLPIAYTLRTDAMFPAFHLHGLWLYIVATICVWVGENESEVATSQFLNSKERCAPKQVALGEGYSGFFCHQINFIQSLCS